METIPVTCPTCFEEFEVPMPAPGEFPVELDYDCEVCCRPMVIAVFEDGGTARAEARGIGD